MRESGLLVEVPEAEPLVAPWRDRYDPVTNRGIPAHITALYPFVPPTDLDAAVVHRLQEVRADVKPFTFRLDRLDEFPEVVWLRPEPDDPFREQTTALWRALPGFPPYRGAYPDSQPHLTVGLADSPAEQARPHRQLADAFADLLPVSCDVSTLTLFTRDDFGEWSRAHVVGIAG